MPFRAFLGEALESISRAVFGPSTVRVDVDVDDVEKRCNTTHFDVDEFLATRRDSAFPVTIQSPSKEKLFVESAKLVHESGTEISLKIGTPTYRRKRTIIEIAIPAEAPVGLYTLTFCGKDEDGDKFKVTLKKPEKVAVLFNAWSKNDGVYMENPGLREEYVLNTKGRLYAGDLMGIPWNLALYRPDCLRAVMFLLEKRSKLNFEQRRNPVHVCREMSALVNVQDDFGVLVGRWDGNYEDGRQPEFWRGSGEILQQYYQSNGAPVRYGQCWVFSGVLLSVLRILGIPSRSVTNFSSAHDTDRNRTVDEYYNEDGEKVGYLSSGSDSVWNFHVWNEVNLARPDLPSGFGGWQALDATPQEESEHGRGYCTGPASVKAIKEGNSVVYDTNFIIAEVNADIKRYILENGVPRLFKVDTTSVGKTISTKAVGSSKREDLTDQYKYPEGSDWERRALYHGYEELKNEIYDVDFQIPAIKHNLGENIHLQVIVKNRGKLQRVRGSIHCKAITYNGRALQNVQKRSIDVKVASGKKEVITVVVDGEVFTQFRGTKVYLHFDIMLAVIGTAQVFAEEVRVGATTPELKIAGPRRLGLGNQSRVVVRFKNPLPVPMEDITLNIESNGHELLHDDIVHNIGTVGAHAEFAYPFTIAGLKLGSHDLIVGLESSKTELVTGEIEVEVSEEEGEGEEVHDCCSSCLVIESVEGNLTSNRSAHHTSKYDDPGLIVRRGQVFSLTATSKQSFPPGTKIVSRAVFELESRARDRPCSFEVATVSVVEGQKIKIDLKAPASAPVGKYGLNLTLSHNGMVTVVADSIKLILLFNPWCTEDTCHYPKESHLEEYVLNNRGRIWVGSANNSYGRAWQFGQFRRESLEVALWVLGKMKPKERGDPVKVSRHVSAMTNVQDDRGILVGNWSGDYSGGTSPLSWTGSADILAEFNQKKQPVCYGQCWVFSGVQTTLFRCIGIPARSVTNFDSAHDTDFNRAVDKFFDEKGEEISSGDSIWNFHVWNEAYMARPDLPSGFGGWQVLDATPQEESPQGGGYRLGPAPQRAIKLGQRLNYDVEFVISEVNADVRYYTVHKDKEKTLTRVNTTHVGKNISTKAVGSSGREDLTLEYKFAEGSTSERAALLAGETASEKQIDLILTVVKDIMLGRAFSVTATVTNRTSVRKEFRVNLHGKAMLYTGAPGQVVKSQEEKVVLRGGEKKSFQMQVKPSDYLRILEGGNFINFVAMALVPAEKLSVVKTSELRLKTPGVSISLPPRGLRLHQEAAINVQFRNPLSKSLNNGKFFLHGEGFLQDTTINISTVAPRGVAMATLKTIPVKHGSFTMVVRFASDQLADIMGDDDCLVH